MGKRHSSDSRLPPFAPCRWLPVSLTALQDFQGSGYHNEGLQKIFPDRNCGGCDREYSENNSPDRAFLFPQGCTAFHVKVYFDHHIGMTAEDRLKREIETELDRKSF